MQAFIQKNKWCKCFLRFQDVFRGNLPAWQYRISQFPDISNSTILQNCFLSFLYAVLQSFGPATLFLCIHIPRPSVSTLVWCRAHSTSPSQELRVKADGDKPHLSIQEPSSLSQEVGHAAAHPVKDGRCADLEEKGRGKKLRCSRNLEDKVEKEKAPSNTFHWDLHLESKFPRRPSFQQHGVS